MTPPVDRASPNLMPAAPRRMSPNPPWPRLSCARGAAGLPLKATAAAVALLVAGCTHPRAGYDMEIHKRLLEERANEIARLLTVNSKLEGEVSFYKHRSEVLEKEKAERIGETQHLRQGVRRFAEAVRDSFEKAQPEVRDYFGGELCERTHVERRAGILMADRKNRPVPGTILTGGKAYTVTNGDFVFYLLRPVPGEEGRVVAVAKTRTLQAKSEGQHEWTFLEPLVAQKGDLIGLYCYGAPYVPYDDAGTGDVAVVLVPEQPNVQDAASTAKNRTVRNAAFTLPPPDDRQSRAYSFGCFGYVRTTE